MPPRGRKPKALTAAHDHPPSLKLLRDCYQTLNEFQQTVAEKARSSEPGANGRTTVTVFNQLLDYFKAVIDHELDDREATSTLILQGRRLCHLFRYQLSCLYSLPLKNIFTAIRSSAPVSSSPIVGLMSYIYHTKLEDCRARVSEDYCRPNLKIDASLMAQSWESILAAFGDGIRLFMNNSENGPKLNQFQILVGKVLYPFLGNVLRSQDSDKTQKMGEHVKRSLLDAGEALSGGCAENKEYIRDSNIFGPAILSHIISDHSDFITANIALQLAFAVAPPLRGEKGVGKNQNALVESTRKEWFEKIFPLDKFRASLREELVSRLSSMSSKQFWTDMGEIQARLFEDNESRACALPIQSGAIDDKRIRLNNLIVPILQSTVQFNKSSLTWCSLDLDLSDDSINENAEVTAEVCYDAILETRLAGLSGSGKPLPDFSEMTLSIDLKSDSSFEGCAPTIRYAPRNGTHRATLVLKLEPQKAAAVLGILKARKIKFSHLNLESRKTNLDRLNITSVNTTTDFLEAEDNVYRESSKISICKEPVCSLEAEAYPDLSQGIPVVSNSRERVASVQRDASIHSSRGVGSSSVSMEKNYQAQGTSKDHFAGAFPNTKNKFSLNKTDHTGTSDRSVLSIVSGTDCDDEAPNLERKRKFDQLKKPGRSWARKGIIQSPQTFKSPASLSERRIESLHATATLGVSKLPESDPSLPLIQITPQLDMQLSPKTTSKEPCDLDAEQDRENNETRTLGGKSWKTLVKKNQKSLEPSPHQLKILHEKTAPIKVAKSSLTEKSKLNDAESTDSIDDADEEISEIREIDTEAFDNSDEEDVIVEDVSDKEFSGPSKKLKVLDVDAKQKPTVIQSKNFNRPVVSTLLESLVSTNHKKEPNSVKNDKITFSMDSDEGMGAIDGCTAQKFHLEDQIPSCNFNEEALELDVANNSKTGPFNNDDILSKIRSGKLGNPESVNRKKEPKEPRNWNKVLSSETSSKLFVQPKKIAQQNVNHGMFLNLGERGYRDQHNTLIESRKRNGASSHQRSRNAKLELEMKNMAQQKERLAASTGQSLHDSLIGSPKYSVFDGTQNTTKSPLPTASAYKVAIDENNSLQADPSKPKICRVDRGQHTCGNGDTSEGLNTPLSRKLLGNSKAEIEPVFKYSKDETRENHDISRKNQEKKLRFESPRQASVKRETIGSMSAKRKARRSNIFPFQPEELCRQEEVPHSIKKRNLRTDALPSNKDPLKSALKTTAAPVPQNVFNFAHLEMKPGKNRLQGVPHLEIKDEIPRGSHRESPLIEKLSHQRKNSPALKYDSGSHEDVFELGNWRKKSRSKPSGTEKNEAAKAQSVIGKNNSTFEASKDEASISSCMDQLTQLVLTGIRNKKVKIEGIAVNTRLGIFNLTNNLIKEFDQQNKEILESVSHHAIRRQNEYKECYDQVVNCRKRTDQDLAWIKKYRNQCEKQAHLV